MATPAPAQSEPATVRPAGSAARSPVAWITLILVALVGLWIDLASKEWAFRTVAGTPVVVDRETVLSISQTIGPGAIQSIIPPHPPQEIIPNLLNFTLVLNPGAVFGIGAGKRVFFMVFTGLALIGGLLLFTKVTRAKDHAPHIGIGLLICGGLGNLYDRIYFGCVRDFIHPLPGMMWPFGISTPWGGREVWSYVSNVADLFLIIGIIILSIYLWRIEPRRPQPIPPSNPMPEPGPDQP